MFDVCDINIYNTQEELKVNLQSLYQSAHIDVL